MLPGQALYALPGQALYAVAVKRLKPLLNLFIGELAIRPDTNQNVEVIVHQAKAYDIHEIQHTETSDNCEKLVLFHITEGKSGTGALCTFNEIRDRHSSIYDEFN